MSLKRVNAQDKNFLDQKIEWSCHDYLSNLSSSIDTNMTYLHSTLSWSVTVLFGGIGIVLARPSFPDVTGIMILLLLVILIGHFTIRTGKAYMNVMRFTNLEKMVISSYLKSDTETQWENNFKRIIEYHCEWKNPLTFTAVAKHVLFKLGFVYFLGVSVGLVAYSIWKIGFDIEVTIFVIITAFIFVLEIWFGFIKSDYFKGFEIHKFI
jgi:hypothetical protein